MGTFRTEVVVAKPSDEPAFSPAGQLLVDTGSENTWIRASLLRELGIKVAKTQRYVTADGREIVRDIGFALLRCEGFLTVDEVVFAHDTDLQLLGARTLEGFNARVDAVNQRLVAAGPIVAAAA